MISKGTIHLPLKSLWMGLFALARFETENTLEYICWSNVNSKTLDWPVITVSLGRLPQVFPIKVNTVN